MKKEKVYAVTENPRKVERSFLVGVQFPEVDDAHMEEMLDELEELSTTLGVAVVGRQSVRLRKPQSRLLTGSGKAREICAHAKECGADVILFDEQLTPAQQRNWERLAGIAVIDRQEVILDIFAQRANTREAVLQVTLAQAEYELPRLKRRWTHLSRQRGMKGGLGLRGEGEQQIEVDYRLVQRRIAFLKSQIEGVRKQRQVQRSRRLKKPVPTASIIGYTNAGKSSLLNALTESHVLTEDKLFATLDPTVRRIVLPNRQELLLTDTVGFIRKLPHLLVEAFKATLEEALVADFLIEVIDVSSRQIDEHHRTTRDVLKEIGADDKFVITVFNKIDCVDDRLTLRRLRRHYPDAVFMSARTGEGLDSLMQRLADELDRKLQHLDLVVPHDRYDIVAKLHRTSHIIEKEHTDSGVTITATVPDNVRGDIEEFVCTGAGQ